MFQTFNIVVLIFLFGGEMEKAILDAFDVQLKYQQSHPTSYLPFDLNWGFKVGCVFPMIIVSIHSMWIWDQMKIGKTYPTLDLRQNFKILPFFFNSQIDWFLRITKLTLIGPSISRIVFARSILSQIISRSILSLAGLKRLDWSTLTWKNESEIGITWHSRISWISWTSKAWIFRSSWAAHQRILENKLFRLPLIKYR